MKIKAPFRNNKSKVTQIVSYGTVLARTKSAKRRAEIARDFEEHATGTSLSDEAVALLHEVHNLSLQSLPSHAEVRAQAARDTLARRIIGWLRSFLGRCRYIHELKWEPTDDDHVHVLQVVAQFGVRHGLPLLLSSLPLQWQRFPDGELVLLLPDETEDKSVFTPPALRKAWLYSGLARSADLVLAEAVARHKQIDPDIDWTIFDDPVVPASSDIQTPVAPPPSPSKDLAAMPPEPAPNEQSDEGWKTAAPRWTVLVGEQITPDALRVRFAEAEIDVARPTYRIRWTDSDLKRLAVHRKQPLKVHVS